MVGLQAAFHINHLLEIQESFQKLLNHAGNVEGVGGCASAENALISNSSAEVVCHCSEHPAMDLELYCETCRELVCFKCVIKDGKHHNHEYALLEEAFVRHKEEITASLKPVEKQVESITDILGHLDSCSDDISNKRAATEEEIHTTFRRLQETLSVREGELISHLDHIAGVKLKGLALQRDQIETTLAQLTSCLHFWGGRLSMKNKRTVLRTKEQNIEQMKQLTTVPITYGYVKS